MCCRCGKSTLLQLVCKLQNKIERGTLQVNSIPYQQVSRTALRSLVSYVSQVTECLTVLILHCFCQLCLCRCISIAPLGPLTLHEETKSVSELCNALSSLYTHFSAAVSYCMLYLLCCLTPSHLIQMQFRVVRQSGS